MSGDERERLEKELKEMKKNCEDLRQQMGLSHDNSQQHTTSTTAAGDQPSAAAAEAQPSVATSSATADGFSVGGGTSGAAGGAAPSTQEGKGTDGGGIGDLSLLRRLVGGKLYSRPPHLPRDPKRQVAWYRQLCLWLANEGLEDTLTVDAVTGPVSVISSSRSLLLSRHPENVVDDHFRAWSFIFESVAGSDLEERLVSCATVAEAWSALKSWVLPTTRAEKYLLEVELNNVQYDQREPPKMLFARIDRIVNTLRLVGVEKTPEEVLAVMIDQLPEEYAIQKAILREKPNVTRRNVEETLGNAYADKRLKEMRQTSSVPNAAPLSYPHAFAVSGFSSGRGGSGRRRCRATRWRFGSGWLRGPARPHGQTGLGGRRRRRRRQRYRFEGHCGYCGQWGHMKRDCILAHGFRAQGNDLVQPRVNVVAPGYSFAGFATRAWPDDVPWQGQEDEATMSCDAGMPAYGGAYAPLPPQLDLTSMQQQQQQQQLQQGQQDFSGSGAHGGFYVPKGSTPGYWNVPPCGSDQRGDNGDYEAVTGNGMENGVGMLAHAFRSGVEEDMGQLGGQFLSSQRGFSPPSPVMAPDESTPPTALVGGAAGRLVPLEETPSTPVSTTPGGSAASIALANETAGLPAPPQTSSSTPVATASGGAGGFPLPERASSTESTAVPSGRVSSTALAERTAGQPAPENVCRVSVGRGDLSGRVDRAEVPGVKHGKVYKTSTAPVPDPMPPDLNAFAGNFL